MGFSAVQWLRVLLVVCGVGSIVVFLGGQAIAATKCPWQRLPTTAPALWAELGKLREGNKVLMCVFLLSTVRKYLTFAHEEAEEVLFACRSPAEQIMIESHLLPSHSMLEWGSGFSTLWYSQFVKDYYSIEHHQEWYQNVQQLLKDHNASRIHYTLSHVPDGHKGWPGGYDEGNKEQFMEYIHAAASFRVRKFDRVLIDGRARAACIEYILPYLKPDSVVFVHDYQTREVYHEVVTSNYELIGSINSGQSIVAVRPKFAKD